LNYGSDGKTPPSKRQAAISPTECPLKSRLVDKLLAGETVSFPVPERTRGFKLRLVPDDLGASEKEPNGPKREA
jgi:hypothetical protein